MAFAPLKAEVFMKVAIPIFGPRVSPRFDCAPSLLLFTVEDGKVVERGEEKELSATFVIAADGGASLSLRSLRPEFSRAHHQPNLQAAVDLVFDLREEARGLRGVLFLERPRAALRVYPSFDGLHLTVPSRREGDWETLLEEALPLLRRHFAMEAEEPKGRRPALTNRMGMLGHFSPGLGSVLLAGEAAGLLDAWGDGIEAALRSGEIAGRAVVDCAGERVLPYRYYAERLKELRASFESERRGQAQGDLLLQGSPLDVRKAGGRRRYRRLLRRLAGP